MSHPGKVLCHFPLALVAFQAPAVFQAPFAQALRSPAESSVQALGALFLPYYVRVVQASDLV